ncbi:MAG: zinc-binding dehydrogenase [Pseudomonadales bacterium]|nr:zinc-binding dehydrogenase [Pseudomonadales bacterium]
MKAAIYHGPLQVTTEDIEQPDIGPEDILVRVHACGICGSDLHLYKLGMFVDQLCRKSPGGLIPGHEFSGEIVDVGSKVTDMAIGDRVVAFTFGGMAEYVPVSPARLGFNVHKVPDSVPHRIAATLEPLANSVHAAMKGEPQPGETALVFGVGIIGLGVIQCLKALDTGLAKIIAVDVSDKRLQLAHQVGADATINASREDIMARVPEIAGTTIGLGGVPMPAVDIVYDCVGLVKDRPEPPVIQQAIDLVRPGTGRIVIHGIFEAPVTLELSMFVGKQAQILGSYGMTPPETVKAMELLESGAVDRDILISHEFPLGRASEAFNAQVGVEGSVKVIVNP